MSVKKEPSGRRSIQVEVEVPGTPEEVWRAIATGEGITAWFAPTDLEERLGGKIVFHMMPGMDASATITEWEPPHRLSAEESEWIPGAPKVLTDWTVEARSGGVCVVRVVHSLFASNEDWDGQLEGMERGWPGFFRILRRYLSDFRGQRCVPVRAASTVSGTVDEAWTKLTAALGVAGIAEGRKVSAGPGAPPFSGTVDQFDAIKNMHSAALISLEEPAPGMLQLGVFDCGGMVMACISFFLYGERAAAAAARDENPWQEWMGRVFPSTEAVKS